MSNLLAFSLGVMACAILWIAYKLGYHNGERNK